MQEFHTSLRPGQHVGVRDEPWTVIDVERFEGSALVTLRGIGHDNLGDTRRVLAPFDRVEALAPRVGLVRKPRHAVLRSAAAALAESTTWSACWTAGAARIDLRSWQHEPAMAVIRGATRVLLADEVGLGKTIQAALIVSELIARGLARRVLVLTPASLREQWAAELSDKFGMEATVFDQSSLAATTSALPAGANPWGAAPLIVSSIDLVKRPEVRAALDAALFDVLVVDEAHHVTPGSDRGAVVSDLASRTPWVVLATATPHSGDEAAYRFLRGLGDVQGRDDLLTFRRTAQQLRSTRSRRVRLLAVGPTVAERALLDATLAYARRLWQGTTARSPRHGTRAEMLSPPGARLVAAVIARRAASSARAASVTLQRRLSLIRSDVQQQQTSLPWDECGDDGTPDSILAAPGLPDGAEEARWIERLIQLANSVTRFAKTNAIRRLLRRTGEHLIVFSEYRDVVEALASQITDLASVAVLHGGLDARARRDMIHAFTCGRVRVLVTTDAAGEGLNLQARCRLVVNLELPWNPLRLEQRIGRVDRLGQSRRVHALHLYHRGSFEDTVLARLEERRARASADLEADQPAWSEAEVAEAVLGTSPGRSPGHVDGKAANTQGETLAPPMVARNTEGGTLVKPLIACNTEGGTSVPPMVERSAQPRSLPQGQPSRLEHQTPAAVERRLRSLALRANDTRLRSRSVFASETQRGGSGGAVVLLFVAELLDGSRRRFELAAIPLRVTLARNVSRRSGLTKALVAQLTNADAVRSVLEQEVHRRMVAARIEATMPAAGICARVADMRTGLGSRVPGSLDRYTATNGDFVRAVRPYNGLRRAERAEKTTRASQGLIEISREGHWLVQGSLFDRRNEQHAQASRAAIAKWEQHLERRAAAADALTQLHALPSRLIAAWASE